MCRIIFHFFHFYYAEMHKKLWPQASAKDGARCLKSFKFTSYCNGTALPPERFRWMTARWPASAIRSRKLSINVATIEAWARPTLEILPDHKTTTNEYLAKCVNSYFLVCLSSVLRLFEIAQLTLSLWTFYFFSSSLSTWISAGPVHEPI